MSQTVERCRNSAEEIALTRHNTRQRKGGLATTRTRNQKVMGSTPVALGFFTSTPESSSEKSSFQ